MEGYNEQNILFLKKWILSNDDNMWNKNIIICISHSFNCKFLISLVLQATEYCSQNKLMCAKNWSKKFYLANWQKSLKN